MKFKLPWPEAGPSNHHDDKVNLDQKVVTRLTLWDAGATAAGARCRGVRGRADAARRHPGLPPKILCPEPGTKPFTRNLELNPIPGTRNPNPIPKFQFLNPAP